MRRIKILHFISNGARSHYFRAIADETDKARFDVTVGSLSAAGLLHDEMRERGFGTFALDAARRADFPRATLELTARLRRERFDIVQVHLFEASLVGLTAAFATRVPLTIFTGHHSVELLTYEHKPHLLLADQLCTRLLADYIMSPSDETKALFVEREGVRADKIAVIGYPLDVSLWSPSEDARRRVRQELGVPERAPVFGACARLFRLKNFDEMIGAFARYASVEKEGLLVIVGDGPDRAHLERLAQRLGVGERVRFAGHRKDIADVFSAIDVFVHASRVESCCQVLIEAGLVGKPILSTPVPPTSVLVTPGENGWIVPVGDEPAMADAMQMAFARRSEWPAMGAEVQRRARGYSSKTIVPRMEQQSLEWLAARGVRA